jgi:hypothetical protein
MTTQHNAVTDPYMHKAKIPYGTAAPTATDLDGDVYFQVDSGSGIICIEWHREGGSWKVNSSIRTTSSAITASSSVTPDCVGAIYLLLPGSYTPGGTGTMFVNFNGGIDGWVQFNGTLIGHSGGGS